MAAVFGVYTRKLFLGAITARLLAITLCSIRLSHVHRGVEKGWIWVAPPSASAAYNRRKRLLCVVSFWDRL